MSFNNPIFWWARFEQRRANKNSSPNSRSFLPLFQETMPRVLLPPLLSLTPPPFFSHLHLDAVRLHDNQVLLEVRLPGNGYIDTSVHILQRLLLSTQYTTQDLSTCIADADSVLFYHSVHKK